MNNPRLQVGRRSPNFELDCISDANQRPRKVSLQDYADRWLILMFYPRDFSLVCPTELSALSARMGELDQHGTDVLALSTDTIESHRRWLSAPHSEGGVGPLNFPLASDEDGAVARAYGVYVELQNCALRGLFIIDGNGVVQYQSIHNLSVGRSVSEVLRILMALQTGGLCPENWSADKKPLDPAVNLRPGHVLSNYRIEEKIGEGGFAAVYRAFDLTLERSVALKIIKRTEEGIPRIREEARAAASLTHPNICTIHTLGDLSGVPMIVMEHLNGATLADRAAAGPLAPQRAREIGAQIASGMAAAHAAGVVHGDLKPANIFVTVDDVVKILDFGLATRRRIVLSGAATASVDGAETAMIAGTPFYMAPEQADGAHTSEGGDVFALGLVFYELLTGHRAFGGSSILEVLGHVRAVDPMALACETPAPFDSLLRRMLAPDPNERTISMEDVEAELA